MSIMSWFGNLVERKVRVSLATVMRLGRAVWMPQTAKAFAEEGYAQNVIAFRCIDVIAKSLASIPLVVMVGKGKDAVPAGDDHPLVKLLKRPNPLMTKSDMVHGFVAWKLITGNSYLEKLGPNPTSPPRELWVWPAFDIKPFVAGKSTALPVGYGFDNGTDKVAWLVDQLTGKSCILHWRTFNPLNSWLGMSPMKPASQAVDQRNSADEWNQALLQNHAEPSAVITSEESLTDPQIKQLQTQIESNHMGPMNAKRPLILGGRGIKWIQNALSPKDMDWLPGKNVASRDICAVYGVPTQIVGILGDQTFSNYQQAREALWDDTVIPTGTDMVEQFNHWLADDFPGATIVMDLDNVPALAARRAAKWLTAQNSRFISTNEKRALVDHPPADPDKNQGDGDAILVSAGDVPLSEITGDLGELIPREPKPVIDPDATDDEDDK